jgi:hypothetical protein
MGIWLYDYCVNEIKSLPNEIIKLYDMDNLIKSLETSKDYIQEKNWHIITNAINLGLTYKTYGKI